MRSRQSNRRLLGTTSMLALSVGAVLATTSLQPAQAGASASGLWGGGGTLSALTVRQLFDCYNGKEVAGDGYATNSTFTTFTSTLFTGSLPAACATRAGAQALEGLYAAVGSGRGQQAFIADDALQLVNGGPFAIGGTTITTVYPATVTTPNTLPPFIDTGSSSTLFNTYPYPGLTFAAGDNPLPTVATTTTLTTVAFTFGTYPTTNWATSDIVSTITVAGTTVVSYNAGKLGAPVQFPLFEVPVALAVNTTSLTVQSAATTPTNAGGAIQLSTAQVCAIFSGTVTDWDNSTTAIAALDQNGNLTAQAFYADNVSTTNTIPVQYATTSHPIKVTYRSDGSGTSFIFTNYLKANCVALDSGSGYTFSTTITTSSGTTITTYTVPANHYAAIFGASNLPSTSFSNLVSNVGSTGTANWQSANGSGGVAKAIGTGSTAPATPGAIGYLSVDYTAPYASNLTVGAAAPNSASVQDEYQRETGVYHPSTANFIAPTPAGADTAFVSLDANANPNTSADYNAWNLYTYTYPSTYTNSHTGAATFLQGKSLLGIPDQQNAYPLVGTTYFYAYNCYANTNVVSNNPPVADFLTWFYNSGSSTPRTSVEALLENNGFHGLNTGSSGSIKNLAGLLYNEYLVSGAPNLISKAGASGTVCSGISGGA